ncbi:hypothetical protein HNY73_013093 [Argiope bruennichi]|uniref:Uncharacterized protein n=1 Tax=Argiope bruennichi TaxID=94029 RepID=A0A8T0F1R5_ARGBR|nr:hypothetical protein HNY73_013093 [Argiope bruennichi]
MSFTKGYGFSDLKQRRTFMRHGINEAINERLGLDDYAVRLDDYAVRLDDYDYDDVRLDDYDYDDVRLDDYDYDDGRLDDYAVRLDDYAYVRLDDYDYDDLKRILKHLQQNDLLDD